MKLAPIVVQAYLLHGYCLAHVYVAAQNIVLVYSVVQSAGEAPWGSVLVFKPFKRVKGGLILFMVFNSGFKTLKNNADKVFLVF